MNPRKLLTEALNGEEPRITPLSIYSWMMEEAEGDWEGLLDQGLGLCQHRDVVQYVEHGVESTFEERKEGGDRYVSYRKDTPVGDIEKVEKNGWRYRNWIEEPGDYEVMQWITEHTELVTKYEDFHRSEEAIGESGLTVVTGSRTPAMSIMWDWTGPQKFALDLAREVPQLFQLYEERKKVFREETELIAKGPGRFVKWLENLTIDMLGPDRYRDLLLPIYEECIPLLREAEKRVMVHYDGQLEVIADDIAQAPFHIVESLTEPPEGDMTYDRCRRLWPDKVLWGNINVALYSKPEEELRQAVVAKRERAGKKGFAFEISEELPHNWEESIPVVLDTLRELS